MTEQTELDRTRRYLVPVKRFEVSAESDVVCLSMYEWLPRWEEWVTGLALCGASAVQGALPEGTVVTCPECEAYRPKYERYLAPGYMPEDDDPEVLRARIAELERERDVLRRSLARLADVVANFAAFAFGHRDSRGKVLRVKWRAAERVLAYTSGPADGCDCDRTAFRRSCHAGHLVTCPQRYRVRPRHFGKQAGR